MKINTAISPSELKPAFHFWFFVQNYWTDVYQSSRHTKSYLNFPGHLSLKIAFVFSPQLLRIETPCMIVPIRNQICKPWDDPKCLVLFVNNIINRIKKNIIQKDKEGKNNWIIMMSKVWQGLWLSKDENKKFIAQIETLIMLNPKKYISVALNSIKYCPEMHLLFNPICNSIILVKKKQTLKYTQLKLTSLFINTKLYVDGLRTTK